MVRVSRKSKEVTNQSGAAFCRKIVKGNIVHSREIPLLGLDAEYRELYNLVLRTVEGAESNSAVVIGPRGCGKTALINNVLRDIKNESKQFKDTIIVNLNGYIHTDDRLSLIAITSQMKLDNCVGDRVFGSFAENLTFLLQCLSVGSQKTSKSVVFILEEFDLFCNHRNQTLLYNLFDRAQSAQAPICVLGLTCRKDITERIEKRVMSRFSNRQIHIYPTAEETEAESFQRRIEMMRNILTVKNNSNYSYVIEWNNTINKLCSDPVVQDCLKTMFDISQCENTFRNFLFLVISRVSDDHPALKPDDFVEAYEIMKRNLRVKLIEGLSVMEVCLIISMKHHTEIYDGSPFNFEMVLRRYLDFARHSVMLTIDRQVMIKGFENLKKLELIQPVPSAGNRFLNEYQLYYLLLLPEEVKEAVKNYPGLPTEVQQWALSDLT